MKRKGKRLIVLMLVFMVGVGSFLTLSTTDSVTHVPEVMADIDIDDMLELCVTLNTYIDTGLRDWDGFFKCVGTIMGWR